MGIYLSNMEIPKDREMLCVNIYPDGKVCINLDLECKQIATAVSVPSHGDLIERDALKQDAQKRLLECEKYDNQFQKPYEVMRAIALAPTVIHAEPPKEEN